MNVSKERLSVIGKLIGVYREERRHNTQNEFTQKKFCKGICSPNTLKNIEAGGLSRFEDVYIELLHKFNLKLDEFPAIDEAINQVVDELYVAIDFFDRKKIELLTDKILRVLNKVKDYIYYSEIYSLIDNIQKYYIGLNLIDDKVVERYAQFISENIFVYKDLFRVLSFANIQHLGVIKKEDYVSKSKLLRLEESNRMFVKMILLHYYFTNNEYMKMNKLLLELIKDLNENKNYIRLIDAYNFALVLHSYIEKEKMHIYIKKIEDLIFEHHFPEIKIAEIYSSIASTLYYEKNYKEALNYYDKMLMYYNNENIIKLIYMADCQNHLGLEINIPKVSIDKYNSFPVNIRNIYKYFTFSKDTPPFIKQNFIMRKILPSLEDTLFIELIRYELCELVEITGHYKNIYLFNKCIMKKRAS